jgi:hypothetical protein
MKYWSFVLSILLSSSAFAAESVRYELMAIASNESSGGRNLNHALITRGMHKGTRAGGAWGMMPLTAKYLISSNQKLFAKHGHWLERENKELTEELNTNTIFASELAVALWKRLRRTFGPERAAYAWFYGPGALDSASDEEVHEDPYVKKFKEALQRVKAHAAHAKAFKIASAQ